MMDDQAAIKDAEQETRRRFVTVSSTTKLRTDDESVTNLYWMYLQGPPELMSGWTSLFMSNEEIARPGLMTRE